MKLALAQINPTVGDLNYNTKKIIDFISQAKAKGAELIVFPELSVTGYPPEDLLLKPKFVSDNIECLSQIEQACESIGCFVGFVDKKGEKLFNAGAFITNKKKRETYHKINLPNYSVFDEKRYFVEGKEPLAVRFQDEKIGFVICEDIWVEDGPYKNEVEQGAGIILNINASPYHIGKIKEREKLLRSRAKSNKAFIVYVNMVGGQDELVFDGGSMVIDPQGRVIARASQYKEELLIVDTEKKIEVDPVLSDMEEIYQALVLGVRDYVLKNGFFEVLIGLSGGIDSALTLVLASDALGADKVHTIFMPSQYTSEQSFLDSNQLADNLGIKLKTIPINELFSLYNAKLVPFFAGKPTNITEENLQARIRGNILMAFSNKFNWLVLTTGNKSETSTGYCTLYGDMAGGFNVLKDVPKTLAYKLVEWRNAKAAVIPEAIIKRPPTAELKPNQKDQDTLPPYEILDPIVNAYVEQNLSVKEITVLGFDANVVDRVVSLIDKSEYKRRQSPPGPRITPRAFGKDWRLPITNGYKL